MGTKIVNGAELETGMTTVNYDGNPASIILGKYREDDGVTFYLVDDYRHGICVLPFGHRANVAVFDTPPALSGDFAPKMGTDLQHGDKMVFHGRVRTVVEVEPFRPGHVAIRWADGSGCSYRLDRLAAVVTRPGGEDAYDAAMQDALNAELDRSETSRVVL